MIKDIISKETFVSILANIEKVTQYHKDLNNFFLKHDVDGYVYQPDCMTVSLQLLHLIFDDADKDDYIEKFCYDTCFGKKAVSGLFFDAKGKEINIKSSDELYDLLLSMTS